MASSFNSIFETRSCCIYKQFVHFYYCIMFLYYTIICLSILLLMNILVTYHFSLLWVEQLWVFFHKSFYRHRCSFNFSEIFKLGVDGLYGICMFKFIRNFQFPKVVYCFIFPWGIYWVQVAPYSCQHLILSVF